MTHTSLQRRTWKMRAVDAAAVERLGRARDLPEVVARLLVARGFADPAAAARHLEPDLSSLHDPGLLPDMGRATARLARAVREREVILLHGDYDVDGVTGTALLVRLLHRVGGRVAWHIPNRFTDGYAFGAHSVARALDVGAALVVSVDNGTSSGETIRALAGHGVETIVTDHHEPPEGELPAAAAIVNPKLAGSRYPFRDLCGAAVAFKLAWGLCQELSGGERVGEDLRRFLVEAMAYVAIATVCDVVPLVEENRVLSSFGLRALAGSRHAGLRSLLEVSGLAPGARLGAEDVGYEVGPRINASGRLGSARTALELLLCEDAARARALALELDARNVERKAIERELLRHALAEAERFADAERWPVLVVAGEGWHQGVIGIVAARLAQRYHRPTLVIGMDGARGRGSARSVPGVSVLELLHGGAPHMLRYGGHAQAAGFDVAAQCLDPLREAVCARARELHGEGPPRPPLLVDGAVELAEMTPELMKAIERLAPFGERNEKPVLLSRDLRLAEPPRVVGADRTHVTLQLRRGAAVLKGMAFGMAHRAAELAPGVPLHVVHTPRWNTWRGRTDLELLVHDFHAGVGSPV